MPEMPDAERPRGAVRADGGLGVDAPGGVRRFSHEAMATYFEVYAAHPDAQYAGQAAHAAFDLIDRLERELSRFIPNSDISRINALGAGEATQIGASALECLVIARHMYELTGGAFDVSIGTGLPSLELDPDRFLVRPAGTGVRVDLGGIGKGYAVDRMAELLEEWGIGSALVHGGFSSILAMAPPPGLAGWPLTMSDPTSPSRVLRRQSLTQTAIGASGLQKGAHIVDPRSGRPVHGRAAAWVALPRPEPRGAGGQPDAPRLAASAVVDALTTAFMLLGLDEIEALCAGSPGLEAWILSGDQAELRHFGRAA